MTRLNPSVLLLIVLPTLFTCSLGTRFLSFDASLLLGVDPYSLERLDNINYELALLSLTDLAVHADAVCLQGFWLPYQVYKLQSILSPYLPYSYSTSPVTGICFCSALEVTPLAVCLQTNCTTGTSDEQMLCAFQCLSATLPSMGTICQGCITGQFNGLVTGATNMTNVLNHCVNASTFGDSGDSCVPYGGYSGNVLFSRSKLRNTTTQSLVFPYVNHLFHSDAIFAMASYSGLGDVNLVCTQFQPTGPLNSTQADQLAAVNEYQTSALLTEIERVVNTTGQQQVVVMGNFKQSPNISEAGVLPVNDGYYDYWIGSGYEDPVTSAHPQCTYCYTNPLITAAYLVNTAPSHIFIRGFDNNANVLSIDSEITLNTSTTILDLTGSKFGQAVSVPYSPNYGLVVEFNTVPSAAARSATSWLSHIFS